MNAHEAHTSAMTMAQKLLGPSNQYVLMFATCITARKRSTSPVPFKNIWRQTSAVTKVGITYGTRYSVRTTVRPRYVVLTVRAARIPMGVMIRVVSNEKARLTPSDTRAEAPITFPAVRAVT